MCLTFSACGFNLASTVTRHNVERKEAIVVHAISGAPLQAGSGEGVSAPSNPVPNLAKPKPTKYVQALFLSCGQHVNIHLRSDSSGAIGVASRRGLQRLRHLDVRFLGVTSTDRQQECSNQQSARSGERG